MICRESNHLRINLFRAADHEVQPKVTTSSKLSKAVMMMAGGESSASHFRQRKPKQVAADCGGSEIGQTAQSIDTPRIAHTRVAQVTQMSQKPKSVGDLAGMKNPDLARGRG